MTLFPRCPRPTSATQPHCLARGRARMEPRVPQAASRAGNSLLIRPFQGTQAQLCDIPAERMPLQAPHTQKLSYPQLTAPHMIPQIQPPWSHPNFSGPQHIPPVQAPNRPQPCGWFSATRAIGRLLVVSLCWPVSLVQGGLLPGPGTESPPTAILFARWSPSPMASGGILNKQARPSHPSSAQRLSLSPFSGKAE